MKIPRKRLIIIIMSCVVLLSLLTIAVAVGMFLMYDRLFDPSVIYNDSGRSCRFYPNVERAHNSFVNSYQWLIGMLFILFFSVIAAVFGLWRYIAMPFVQKELYTKDIVNAQERERERFSRELHDGALQSVSASVRRIQIASELLKTGQSESVTENLKEAEKAAQFSADEMRELCDEMSPRWLSLGFVEAISEFAERAAVRDGVSVRLNFSQSLGDLKLSQDKSLTLVRVFQEAHSNAVRHGGAKQITVEMSVKNGVLLFEISDDGNGFDAAKTGTRYTDFSKLSECGHRGIANMSERLKMSGGTLEILSKKGAGCKIVVRIELA